MGISFMGGGGIGRRSMPADGLAFDVATQAELDDHAASAVGRDHALDAIADVLSDHDKSVHDALGIDAETLDGIDSTGFASLPIATADLEDGAVTHVKLAANSVQRDKVRAAELSEWRAFAILGKNTDLSGLAQGDTGFWHPWGGARQGAGNDPLVSMEMPFEVVVRSVRVAIDQNNVDNASVFEVQNINTVDPAVQVSIPAGATGTFDDTGNLGFLVGEAMEVDLVAGAGIVGDTITVAAWIIECERQTP